MSVGGCTGVDEVASRAGAGAGAAPCDCCGVIEAETFITRGSSGVSGCGLLALAPGDAVDSPRWRPGNVSCVGPALLQAASASPATSMYVIFMKPDIAKHVPDRDSACALGEGHET